MAVPNTTPGEESSKDSGSTNRILVAEDSRSIRLGLTRLLERWGYEVTAVENGKEAWERLTYEPISCVITDWMMPELDGIELCRRIRNTDLGHYVYTILLTSREEKGALVEGLEAGADDFLVKPFNRGELEVRIKSGQRVLHLERTLEKRNKELGAAFQTIEQDLKAAAEMQTGLLPPPSQRHGNLLFEWLYTPSTFVGGDILSYFSIDDNRVVFYNIDVSGHGVPAAMLSVTLSKYLTPESCTEMTDINDFDPSEVVDALNNRFQSSGADDQYFTTVFGIYDKRSGEVRLCQAAHPHPILVRANGDVCSVGNGGPPVGLLPYMSYETTVLKLNVGDRLIIHSDGINECENPQGEQYGDHRILDFLMMNHELALDASMEMLRLSVGEWACGDDYGDDLSALGIERCA